MNERLDLLSRDFAVDEPPRRRPFLWFGVAFTVLLLSPVVVVLALRWIPPPTTAFMLLSDVKPVRYEWVPRSKMPESLRRAVVASEDQKFYAHNGFDFEAIEKAMERNKSSRKLRGASTISQQLAKNLFLWPGRSYLRKGLEVSFTILIEALWPKDRILTTYLNVAEFGPGLYGVEAAARKYYHKNAENLSPAEAATLVAVLPSPRAWRVVDPGPYVQTRVDWILDQIGERPRYGHLTPREPDAPSDMSTDTPSEESPPETGNVPLPQPAEATPQSVRDPEPDGESAQPEEPPEPGSGPAESAPADPPPR